MNRTLLLQATVPAVGIGLLLCVTCLLSAWYVNRLQSNNTRILKQHVASLQAAQELEIVARQMRFHCFLYLLRPSDDLDQQIRQDELEFEKWLALASESAFTERERDYVTQIDRAYEGYKTGFDQLRIAVKRPGPPPDVDVLARANPVNRIVDPCRDLLEENERLIDATAKENERLTANLSTAMLLLGLGGPLSGLLGGYGIARGLSRSIHRLSVHVQDISQHLEQDVGSVRLTTSGDIRELDRQLEHVVGRVAEVTERLQGQHRDMLRAQQLSAVGQLAASIAHEVRNPLAAIKLLVEAALRVSNPRPFTAENLRLVQREVLRLEQTLQGFLDFARPPSLQRSSCDLREVVAQAVDLVRARARQQQIGIDVVCPGTPIQAHVDGNQLGTVLVNLLLNALDAMPRDGRLGIRLEAVRTGARLTVTDTGPGIAPEIAPRLFTPFASTKPTGSGLGLSISRRIVEDHGGTLTAANRSEGGARFTVTLPLLRGASQNRHSARGG